MIFLIDSCDDWKRPLWGRGNLTYNIRICDSWRKISLYNIRYKIHHTRLEYNNSNQFIRFIWLIGLIIIYKCIIKHFLSFFWHQTSAMNCYKDTNVTSIRRWKWFKVTPSLSGSLDVVDIVCGRCKECDYSFDLDLIVNSWASLYILTLLHCHYCTTTELVSLTAQLLTTFLHFSLLLLVPCCPLSTHCTDHCL